MALEESHTARLQKIHRYEQMRTMGMLSNMDAQEIRQPVSALRYAPRTIEMAVARDAQDSSVIEKARSQTERINDSVKHVSSYARTDRRNLPINLPELIRETVA